jgi:hypothetical protein
MAISKVSASNTNTINKVVVTDSDAISVITVGTQGLAGSATLLGRTTEAETVDSDDIGAALVYDHANVRWLPTTSSNASSLTTKLAALTFTAGGASVTGVLDEDDFSSNSSTKLATQQSIKAFVEATITAQDLDFQADSGGALNIDLDSETLTLTGGTGIDTSGSSNTVTFAIDSTVATLTGSQTLTNKTLTSPVLNSVDINGGDISSGTTINKSPTITLSGDLSGSVTLTELGNATLTATIASNSVALGTDTTGNYLLDISAGEGIDVSHSQGEGSTATISAELATETNAGVATFDGTDFSVSSGDVTLNAERIQDIVGAMFTSNTETGVAVTYEDSDGTIDVVIGSGVITNAMLAGSIANDKLAGSIANAKLANSSITVTDGSNSTAISLGATLTFTAGEGIDISESSGTITISNEDATETNKGIATFDGTDFTVTSGDVTINAERIQDIVGAMFSSNTETNVTVTYQDSDGTIDVAVDSSSATETLTNKTITNPTISDPEFSGTLLTAPSENTTQTLTVTVASKTSEHPYDGGSSNAYVIDGVEAPYITLTPDTTYRFDQSDSSNSGHPLLFYYESDKTTAYSTGVTVNGTAGNAGAYVEIKATAVTPTVLFYQCSNHALMGNRVNFDTRNFTGFDSDDLTEGSTNLYHTTERVQDIVGGMVSSNTENGIAVTYEDSDGTLDFDVADFDIALTGDVTGSGTVTNLANVSISTTIAANSVALGTDTTGNYVATIAGTSNEITVSGSGSEGATVTISLPDDVTIGNDLTVTGDLTVNGDTVTLNTATLDVEDATIRVAKGATTLSNTNGAGIEFGASSSKPTILWDNSNSRLVANKIFAATSFVGDVAGNSSTTTALANARTIHGVSFDGTANIDLSEVIQDTVGAMFSSNTETGISATYQDSDGTIDLVVATLNQDTTGNAATATALETARTIHGVSFDGTANIDLSEVIQDTVGAMFSSNTETGLSVTYQDSDGTIDVVIGADQIVNSMIADDAIDSAQIADGAIDTAHIADDQVTGDKLANDITIANDLTVSGNLVVTGSTTQTGSLVSNSNFQSLVSNNSGNATDFGFFGKYVESSTTKYAGLFFDASTDNTFRLFVDTQTEPSTTVNTGATGYGVATLVANLTGVASTATALANARTIHGVSFDGTANIDLSEVIQDTVGAMFSSNTETGIAATYQDGDGTIDLVVATLNQDTTGNAATATALETARNIHGVSFDGTANIDLTEVIQDTVGAMFSSNTETGITATYQDSDGTIDLAVGNATTATALENARTIHGVSFDGTQNIDLSEVIQDTVGAMFSSNTETGVTVTYQDADGTIDVVVGNAATATALETARTIHGVSFDGSANIDLTEVIQDTVGAMFSSNTETNITATYQDSDGTIDLVASAGGSSDSIADADNDTKIQVEESSDDDIIRFDTAGTERHRIGNTGKASWAAGGVGAVGTQTRDFTFYTEGSSNGVAIHSNDERLIFMGAAASSGTGVDTGYLQIENGGSAKVAFNSNGDSFVDGGRLLIGTQTSPNNDSDNAHYAKLIAMGNTNSATGDGRLTLARGEASADLSSGDVLGMIAFADNTFHDFALIKGVTDAATGNDDNSGALVFETVPDGSSANAERMRITNAGNVGIGTASPTAPLHIKTSIDDAYSLRIEGATNNSANYHGIGLSGESSNTKAAILFKDIGASYSRGNMLFCLNNDADQTNVSDSDVVMILKHDGNVGIGTTSVVSNARLTVDGGDMMVHGANNSMGISDLLPGYTRGDYGVVYSTANNIYFAVGSSYLSYIGGGSGQYTVSDERMKENVTTLSGTLDKVKQLRGVSHTWKDTEQMGTDTQIGMIAQEVEKIYPELVGDGGLPNDNEGNAPMKSVNYPHLTSVLVEAIKEQQTIIDDLKTRIEALES